ncbi:MAG TPA: VOC family protein [Ignavibacteriaceae bacterium]|nr:VOC family protein [Ignavibacteriaceae bacterium]
MFKGLRTVIYHVDNIDKAKKWYSTILGIQPYFDQPYYVGFNVKGLELGLDPNVKGVKKGNNIIGYWKVDNIMNALKNLLESGAKLNSDIQDVGEGIKVASVLDPFGNIIGIIDEPEK